MEKSLIEQLSQLNKNEKLLLVEALWDSIATDPKDVEVPEHHQSIIESRLQTFEEDKEDGSDWEEIKQKYIGCCV